MRIRNVAGAAVLGLLLLLCQAGGQEPQKQLVPLPKPQTQGGKPLMQALSERKSAREFGSQKLEDQVLSNLLWAAFGINRPDGRRTAPSGMNRQEIDIYAITADGAYMYDAKQHALKVVATGDLRAQAGTQPYAKDAPLNLIFVADRSKMGKTNDEDWLTFSGADTGFISQNVYLFCASEGLVTVVRASVDRAVLGRVLALSPEQRIVLAQSVGYARK